MMPLTPMALADVLTQESNRMWLTQHFNRVTIENIYPNKTICFQICGIKILINSEIFVILIGVRSYQDRLKLLKEYQFGFSL